MACRGGSWKISGHCPFLPLLPTFPVRHYFVEEFEERRSVMGLAALAIATSLLSGCATVRSEGGRFAACPPLVEYGREFQAWAADELALLPEGSAIAEMLSDYAVMREQARTCR